MSVRVWTIYFSLGMTTVATLLPLVLKTADPSWVKHLGQGNQAANICSVTDKANF